MWVRIVKSEKTLYSEDSNAASPNPSGAQFSLASNEISLNQGESKEIVVSVQGAKPNGILNITPPSITGVKVELLSAQGGALPGTLAIDSSGKADFKLKVTSEFKVSGTTVVAPGELNTTLALNGSVDSSPITASLGVKVSNVAVYVMSNVNNVRDLPPRFEFPAGTIPVFANPSNRQVVRVMHFQDGSFRHQAVDRAMPMGAGYCPINTSNSATVPLGGAINPACQPCSPTATTDSVGTFYNHEISSESNMRRTIVCKAKI